MRTNQAKQSSQADLVWALFILACEDGFEGCYSDFQANYNSRFNARAAKRSYSFSFVSLA